MEAVRTSETSVHNHFTLQYIPEDNSEQLSLINLTIKYNAYRYKSILSSSAVIKYGLWHFKTQISLK
jgi:hypothetical protein